MGSVMQADVQRRYNLERSKRLAGNFSERLSAMDDPALVNFLRDPWAVYDSMAKQPPLLKDGSRIKVLILGAGHGGLMYAHHLAVAGISKSDIVNIDLAGGWGGTWYWNRYPGLQCDVEGYTYLPLLGESGFVPKQRYSSDDELRQNCEFVADKFGLQAMFCTEFIGADWNEEKGRWDVRLKRQLGPAHSRLGEEFTVSAQYFIAVPGSAHLPSAPKLPGVEDFVNAKDKTIFHTARWNYEYTGGSQEKPEMHKLKDKVVGICKHLYVFQRTPTYVGFHENSETTKELWDKVTQGGKLGWHRERMDNLDMYFSFDPEGTPEKNLIGDERSKFVPLSGFCGSRRAKGLKPADFEAHAKRMLDWEAPFTARLRDNVQATVQDRGTADKLTPWYPGWCKRPAFHSSYLQTFNRPNVTLVDTDGQGVSAYTRDGAVVGAREYPLDALVLATGFHGTAGDPIAHARGYVRGRGGRDWGEQWRGADFGTFYGVARHGFPNMFFFSTVNVGLSGNNTSIYERSIGLVSHVLSAASARAPSPEELVIEVTKEAEEAWAEQIVENSTWFATLSSCTPGWFTGYKDPERIESEEERRSAQRHAPWGLGPLDYGEILNRYIQEGELNGIELH